MLDDSRRSRPIKSNVAVQLRQPARAPSSIPPRTSFAQQPNGSDSKTGSWLKWGLGLAALAGASAYYRFRPQPSGINGVPFSYRVASEDIRFFHDSTWYENGKRQNIRQITPELIRLIRKSDRFAVMDVFLFCLHHAHGDTGLIPTTRQIVDAFASKNRPAWFITDPLNITYGTAVSAPIRWLQEAGVNLCITDIRKLRDNNLLYSPLWRLGIRFIPNNAPPHFPNPLEKGTFTTPWALLEGINAKGNHRKLLIVDEGDSHTTLLTSSNFEDSSCYFANTGVTIRSTAVARHYLEAEKALAKMSGMDIPVEIPFERSHGDADVTPLMGDQIKQALLQAIESATPQDYLFLFTQYLAERDLIEALVRASQRGVRGTLVLDPNKVSFGNPKNGFPNQLTGPELARRTDFEIRWANTETEEFHNSITIVQKPDRCVMLVGSSNYTRRSLSNTVLEADVRVDVPITADVSHQALKYASWLCEMPRSLPLDRKKIGLYWPKYWLLRFQEATGSGTS
jgi:HKD family nuclease